MTASPRCLWLLSALILVVFTSEAAKAESLVFPAPQSRDGKTIVIASNTDVYAVTPLLRAFQKRYPNITVEYLEYPSVELFEHAKAACETGVFFADMIWSSAMGFQFQLVNDGCAQTLPPNAQTMPDWALWSNELIGLTFEPAAMVYNLAAFPQGAPKSHLELIEMITRAPERVSKIGTYDLESSGVGRLFAFVDAQNSESAARLQLQLLDEQVQSFCCTSQIIDLVGDGRLDIGYNVLGSYALFRAELDPRLGVMFLDDFTPVLSRAAYISKQTQSKATAELFITYAISAEGERYLVERSFLLPARNGRSILSEYIDKPLPFLRPIPLDLRLLLAQ